MVSITLSVPAELKTEMDSFADINWSAVARDAIKRKVDLLHKFREFARESSLTEDDTVTLGRKVNKVLAKRYVKK